MSNEICYHYIILMNGL